MPDIGPIIATVVVAAIAGIGQSRNAWLLNAWLDLASVATAFFWRQVSSASHQPARGTYLRTLRIGS